MPSSLSCPDALNLLTTKTPDQNPWVFPVCQKIADQEQKRPKLFPVCQKLADQEHPPLLSVAERDHSPLLRDGPESPTTHPQRFSGQGLISCPTPCPHFGHPGTSNGQGPHHEIRPCPTECGWWATLPVEAGPAATAAPAAGSNIPEGLSSPAALAQRQNARSRPGMRGNAGRLSDCVSMIS